MCAVFQSFVWSHGGREGEMISPAVIAVMVVVMVVVAVAAQIFENAAIFEAIEVSKEGKS